jgi:hypothetical protein
MKSPEQKSLTTEATGINRENFLHPVNERLCLPFGPNLRE